MGPVTMIVGSTPAERGRGRPGAGLEAERPGAVGGHERSSAAPAVEICEELAGRHDAGRASERGRQRAILSRFHGNAHRPSSVSKTETVGQCHRNDLPLEAPLGDGAALFCGLCAEELVELVR